MQHPPEPGSDPALGDARPRVALRTVQEEVQRAVREIVREPVIVQGASRTDAGVHARGQVAAFTCSGDELHNAPSASGDGGSDGGGGGSDGGPRSAGGWPVARGVDRLVRALNGRLPDDVLIVSAEPVPSGFDPTGGATSKCYTYTIHSSRERPLFDRKYVMRAWEPLDVAAMNDAAGRFVGEHDFASFAALGHGRLTTVRTVHSCRVQAQSLMTPESLHAGLLASATTRAVTPIPVCGFEPQRVVIEVTGSGFLWNMVRIIAGTLVEVGRGRRCASDIDTILASRDRTKAGVTLPPTGLCLEWIRYAP